jgi:DNA mismatch repair protein MutS
MHVLLDMKTTKMDPADRWLGYSPGIAFEVDQQTWKDLDLFDQGRVGSVFALFNRVKTAGGEEALERMLKTPSNQRMLLEGRRDTIRFFRDRDIDLPVGREQLKKIEHYLSCCFSLFPNRRSKALIYSIRHQLKQKPSYLTISYGVRTTVSLLRHLFALRVEWLAKDCPAVLADELTGLPELITDRRVRELLLGDGGRLKMMDLARCDHYFRGTGKACLRRLIDLIYDWDVFEAVARVAQQHNLSFPFYDDAADTGVQAQGLFHPLLINAVPNDYEMGQEANLCFISGASMSGKSTFLKSFGLAVYLAHLGFPVAARSFRTTIFNGLITTVNLADSISQGYSHFYAEVRRVKEIIHQLREKKRIVVIFDELFRGTHMQEAGDASLQVIDALAGIRGSLFLISTHIVEIADGLQGNPNIRFACFESTMEGGVPWCSYKLEDGVCNERVAMVLLRNEGILEMLEEMQVRGKCSNF